MLFSANHRFKPLLAGPWVALPFLAFVAVSVMSSSINGHGAHLAGGGDIANEKPILTMRTAMPDQTRTTHGIRDHEYHTGTGDSVNKRVRRALSGKNISYCGGDFYFNLTRQKMKVWQEFLAEHSLSNDTEPGSLSSDELYQLALFYDRNLTELKKWTAIAYAVIAIIIVIVVFLTYRRHIINDEKVAEIDSFEKRKGKKEYLQQKICGQEEQTKRVASSLTAQLQLIERSIGAAAGAQNDMQSLEGEREELEAQLKRTIVFEPDIKSRIKDLDAEFESVTTMNAAIAEDIGKLFCVECDCCCVVRESPGQALPDSKMRECQECDAYGYRKDPNIKKKEDGDFVVWQMSKAGKRDQTSYIMISVYDEAEDLYGVIQLKIDRFSGMLTQVGSKRATPLWAALPNSCVGQSLAEALTCDTATGYVQNVLYYPGFDERSVARPPIRLKRRLFAPASDADITRKLIKVNELYDAKWGAAWSAFRLFDFITDWGFYAITVKNDITLQCEMVGSTFSFSYSNYTQAMLYFMIIVTLCIVPTEIYCMYIRVAGKRETQERWHWAVVASRMLACAMEDLPQLIFQALYLAFTGLKIGVSDVITLITTFASLSYTIYANRDSIANRYYTLIRPNPAKFTAWGYAHEMRHSENYVIYLLGMIAAFDCVFCWFFVRGVLKDPEAKVQADFEASNQLDIDASIGYNYNFNQYHTVFSIIAALHIVILPVRLVMVYYNYRREQDVNKDSSLDNRNDTVSSIFAWADLDNDGMVSKEELAVELTKPNSELATLLENAGIFSTFYVLEQMDVDGDGNVDIEEFKAAVCVRGGNARDKSLAFGPTQVITACLVNVPSIILQIIYVRVVGSAEDSGGFNVMAFFFIVFNVLNIVAAFVFVYRNVKIAVTGLLGCSQNTWLQVRAADYRRSSHKIMLALKAIVSLTTSGLCWIFYFTTIQSERFLQACTDRDEGMANSSIYTTGTLVLTVLIQLHALYFIVRCSTDFTKMMTPYNGTLLEKAGAFTRSGRFVAAMVKENKMGVQYDTAHFTENNTAIHVTGLMLYVPLILIMISCQSILAQSGQGSETSRESTLGEWPELSGSGSGSEASYSSHTAPPGHLNMSATCLCILMAAMFLFTLASRANKYRNTPSVDEAHSHLDSDVFQGLSLSMVPAPNLDVAGGDAGAIVDSESSNSKIRRNDRQGSGAYGFDGPVAGTAAAAVGIRGRSARHEQPETYGFPEEEGV